MSGMKRFAEKIAAELGTDDICDPGVVLLGTLWLEGVVMMKCPDCGGTGLAETELYEGLVNCFRCKGTGYIKILEQDLPDNDDET